MAFLRRVKAMGGAHTEMNFERQEDISIDVIVDHCLRYVSFQPKSDESSRLLQWAGSCMSTSRGL